MLNQVVLPLVGGVILLTVGAEGLVRGSVTLARRAGISPLVVGLTLVAFGTSAPELVVSVRAALAGNGDVSVGNVVGSNIANIALILAVAALIRPLRVEARLVRLDVPLVLAISILSWWLVADGRLDRVEGAGLLTGLAIYVGYGYRLARGEPDPAVVREFEEGEPAGPRSNPAAALWIVVGLGMLAGGAELTVLGAVRLATGLGISQAVIGLTVVAIGTSLPELATSLVAAARGESDVAIGNVVGSNLFNLLGILGVSSVVRPFAAPGIAASDWIAMIVAAVLLLPLARTGHRLSRVEGGVLLLGYAAYVAMVLWRAR